MPLDVKQLQTWEYILQGLSTVYFESSTEREINMARVSTDSRQIKT